MSGSTQQGISYADRPLGTISGSGVYASTEFQQYLERLSSMVGSLPAGQTSLQGEINTINSSITSINSQIATINTKNTQQDSAIVDLQQSIPVTWQVGGAGLFSAGTFSGPGPTVLTSDVAATVIAENLLAGRYLMVGNVYFTGNANINWGRSSVGTDPAVIETGVGQSGNIYCGSPGADPAVLGFDVATTAVVWYYVNNVQTTMYLNAMADFRGGSLSAYGSLTAIPFGGRVFAAPS